MEPRCCQSRLRCCRDRSLLHPPASQTRQLIVKWHHRWDGIPAAGRNAICRRHAAKLCHCSAAQYPKSKHVDRGDLQPEEFLRCSPSVPARVLRQLPRLSASTCHGTICSSLEPGSTCWIPIADKAMFLPGTQEGGRHSILVTEKLGSAGAAQIWLLQLPT